MKVMLLLVVSISLVTLVPTAFSESVPDWVKNTAGWWATDAISETEFVNAIQYLISVGIIVLDNQDNSITCPTVTNTGKLDFSNTDTTWCFDKYGYMKTNDKINWKNCDLNGAILHSIYLDNAILEGINFSNGKFIKAHFGTLVSCKFKISNQNLAENIFKSDKF